MAKVFPQTKGRRRTWGVRTTGSCSASAPLTSLHWNGSSVRAGFLPVFFTLVSTGPRTVPPTWCSINVCVCAQSLSCVQHLVAIWTTAHQVPLSLEFSRQEYWSGLPFPSPGDLPHPGMEPTSPAPSALAGGFFTTVPPGKPQKVGYFPYNTKKDICK